MDLAKIVHHVEARLASTSQLLHGRYSKYSLNPMRPQGY